MATLNVSKEDINKFSYLINYDFAIFMDLYRMLTENNVPLIIAYFKENETEPDKYSFNFLTKLIKESIVVDNLIKTNMRVMENMAYWEILDFFEDIKIKLETYSNLKKWLRSNKTLSNWGKTTLQIDYEIGKYETLEDVSGNFNDPKTQQDDWQTIALENNLTEIEYTTEGGKIIKVNKDSGGVDNLFLDSVIDSLSGEKLYGLDIDKKLQFVDGDLLVKSYNDTVIQSVDILLTLKLGDIPEFPKMGMNNAVGNNVMSFYYISVMKQLQANFATDDSLRNFVINNMYYSNGDMFIVVSVDTFYNLTINKKEAKI